MSTASLVNWLLASPVIEPDPRDKRFTDAEWSNNQFFDFLKQAYLLTAQWGNRLVAEAEGLDPDTQLAVYQHFKNPIEARNLFAGLTDAKTYDDRLEEDLYSKGDLIVKAMEGWKEEGFPGTWESYWEKFYSQHKKEHGEWLTWLKSDSNMSFWDWKEKQAQQAP